jgi:thiamine biosynthesis lipoprotein ApbE
LNFIRGLGYQDVFVEIGGKLRYSGRNRWNKPWRVGIENPDLIGTPLRELTGEIIDLNLNLISIATIVLIDDSNTMWNQQTSFSWG